MFTLGCFGCRSILSKLCRYWSLTCDKSLKRHDILAFLLAFPVTSFRFASMAPSDDFSTNRYSVVESAKIQTEPCRHPDICFNDGNLAILTSNSYFLVHQGLVCRHSVPLDVATKALESTHVRFLEGRPVLHLQDSPDDMCHFLLALYDGISSLTYDRGGFSVVSALLRLSTKYQVNHLRSDILRALSVAWPSTLAQWESREEKAINAGRTNAPSEALPHPIMVINLARAIGAPELLPSAFYDLSRCSPSETAAGYTQNSEVHQLSKEDLMSVLRGREHASRFLSTFIVNELEGREPSMSCARQKEGLPRHRTCQAAFEVVTFDLLRDVNGVVGQRSSDPLYAILHAELMQTRGDLPGVGNSTDCRPCEYCRSDFVAVVDSTREDFWYRLPQWFSVDLPAWP